MTNKVTEVRLEVNEFAARKYMDALFALEIKEINKEMIRDNYSLLKDISIYLTYDFYVMEGENHTSINDILSVHNGFYNFWNKEFLSHFKPEDFTKNPTKVKGLIILRHAANRMEFGRNPYSALGDFDYDDEFERLKIKSESNQ